MTRALLLLILSLASSPLLAEAYQWRDENGNLVFSDKPPSENKADKIQLRPLEKSGANFGTSNEWQGLEFENREEKPLNSFCRRKVSELNKIRTFLQHSNNDRDKQKASDLEDLITQECGKQALSQRFNDSHCDRYRRQATKIRIYLKHTPNDRDKQRLTDLQEQIKLECQ